MSNFIDNDISLFINNKNKDKFFKNFNDNLKDKKRDFNDNFNNITVSLFTGIENNISICYKFQNDFNDYFQDKNNKNINDYKSIYTNNDDKDKYFIYFSNFIMIDKGDFIDNFNDECVSFIMGIGNNINNNENFNKDNNENKDICNINFDNYKGIFISFNYDNYFCKDF